MIGNYGGGADRDELIVAVPEAERAVGRFRATLDTAASWGVPAHVTVLYPFLPPERINDDVLTALSRIFKAIQGFDASFADVKWFGDTVVWLAPQPDVASEPVKIFET